MEVTVEMVRDLRESTSAGVLDCKKALQEAEGDFDKAVEILQEKGLNIAAKKAGREANEGLIGNYVHMGGKLAALVEVNCETDFVARTDEFQTFVHDLAMQVVASQPLYLAPKDVPQDVIENQKKIYKAQMDDTNKPEHIMERITEGKLAKYYEQVCLMEQDFIKDPDTKIKDLVTSKIAELGENIIIRRFVRFEVGEEE
jgi:elongation factor Ts